MRDSAVWRVLLWWAAFGWLLGAPVAGAVQPTVATGWAHTLAVGDDGRVSAWGANDWGQLGLQKERYATLPQAVNFSDGVGGASGLDHTLLLKGDGSVWAFGNNTFGQLGSGNYLTSRQPVPVVGITEAVTELAAGQYFSLALTADGAVYAWGSNGWGVLNSLELIDSATPRRISGLPTIVAIATTRFTAFAVGIDGSVWGWGSSADGLLGERSSDSATPLPLAINGVVRVAAGVDAVYALKGDGSVWAWGNNNSNQLGNGGSDSSALPTQVVGLTNITTISAGSYSAFAIDSAGRVWGWGSNLFGQLAVGATLSLFPTPVLTDLSDVTALSAGEYHTLALKTDGTVVAVGSNETGQLGNGTLSSTGSATPLAVSGLSGITAILAGRGGYGSASSMAFAADGTFWGWGNGFGDALAMEVSPLTVEGLDDVVAVAGGWEFSLALRADGTVWAWGRGELGQLGNGPGEVSSVPIQVAGVEGITQIAAGAWHALALKADGTLWTWGINPQLTGLEATLPAQVEGISDVVAISAGAAYSLALKADGTVWAWGQNNTGQLGLGYSSNSGEMVATPTQVVGLTGVSAIAAGLMTSAAILGDGSVWRWGQLYGANPSSSSTPAQIAGVDGAVAIRLGAISGLILRQNGSVWAFGIGSNGSLGQGEESTLTATALPVVGLDGIVAIDVGGYHNIALRADGTLWTWGANAKGQLGNGTLGDRWSPSPVIDFDNHRLWDTIPSSQNRIVCDLMPKVVVRLVEQDNGFLEGMLRMRPLLEQSLWCDTAEAEGDLQITASSTRNNQIWVAANATCLGSCYDWFFRDPITWGLWQTGPFPVYLSNVAPSLTEEVRVEVGSSADLYRPELRGTTVYLGYGLNQDEMLAAGRYEPLVSIP